ncbi:MAG: ABC transporter substrate-binding protein, partial [Mariniphaga sp.]|nr:ABC transporter substrate-binding protein [Mariniphaga sp.]
QGGLFNKKIKIIFEDSKAEPKLGVSAANKLINVDKVQVIIGAVASSVTLAIAPLAEKNEIILISPASSSPKITDAGDFIFRNYPSDVLEGELVANFAIKKNYEIASILTINNEYGIGLNRVFEENYKKNGGKILSNDSYSEGIKDYRTILLKIKSLNPKCVFIVGYGREMGTAIKQARELGIKSQFLSTVNFYDKESINSGGDAVNGVIFSSPVFDPNSQKENISLFVKQFSSEFGIEPDVWSAHGYDALLLIVEAIKNSSINSIDIKNELYKIKDFPGVSGKTTFDSNGDVIKDARFLVVQNGEFIPYKEN